VIHLTLIRDGKSEEMSIKAASFPPDLALDLAFDRLGFKVEDLDRRLAAQYKLEDKESLVIVAVKKGSQADKIGIEPGDLVRGINDLSINNKQDFTRAVIRYRLKEQITVLIQRGWRVYSVSFKM
jgi:serine protease Do